MTRSEDTSVGINQFLQVLQVKMMFAYQELEILHIDSSIAAISISSDFTPHWVIWVQNIHHL